MASLNPPSRPRSNSWSPSADVNPQCTSLSSRGVSHTTNSLSPRPRRTSWIVSAEIDPQAMDLIGAYDANLFRVEVCLDLLLSNASVVHHIRFMIELFERLKLVRDTLLFLASGNRENLMRAFGSTEEGVCDRLARLLVILNGGTDLESEPQDGICRLQREDEEHMGTHDRREIVESTLRAYRSIAGLLDDGSLMAAIEKKRHTRKRQLSFTLRLAGKLKNRASRARQSVRQRQSAAEATTSEIVQFEQAMLTAVGLQESTNVSSVLIDDPVDAPKHLNIEALQQVDKHPTQVIAAPEQIIAVYPSKVAPEQAGAVNSNIDRLRQGEKHPAQTTVASQLIMPLDPSKVGPQQADTVRWMSKYPDSSFQSLLVPGAHNSGATHLTNRMSPEYTKLQTVSSCIAPYMKSWATSQRDTMQTLLYAGCRYFDIQIGIDMQFSTRCNDRFFLCYNVFGRSLKSYLDDMRMFLDAHPTEMILLHITNVKAFETMKLTDHEELINCIVSQMGGVERFVPNKLRALTLRQLWSRGHQIFLAYDGFTLADQTSTLDIVIASGLVCSISPNTNVSKMCTSFLSSGLQLHALECRDKFLVLQGVLTPRASDYLLGVACGLCFPTSLESFSRTLPQELSAMLNTPIVGKLRHGAVFCANFISEEPELIRKLILLNEDLHTSRTE